MQSLHGNSCFISSLLNAFKVKRRKKLFSLHSIDWMAISKIRIRICYSTMEYDRLCIIPIARRAFSFIVAKWCLQFLFVICVEQFSFQILLFSSRISSITVSFILYSYFRRLIITTMEEILFGFSFIVIASDTSYVFLYEFFILRLQNVNWQSG